MEITALILTYNEAPNIRRTLERLSWAREIIVVDSFSTDETLEIVKNFPQARVVQRKFDSFADQCNFGLEQVQTDWVLSLDADYVLSDQIIDEIHQLTVAADVSRRQSASSGTPPSSDLRSLTSGPVVGGPVVAYSARFRYCIAGHPLRASLYPPRTVLYRKSQAHYINDGHGHRVQIDGFVGTLSGWIDHDDRKPLDRWLQEQSRYARIEAGHLLNTPSDELNFPDRLRRKIVFAPFLVFLYTLFGKGLILDGWPGWYYVLQRTLAEMILSLRLVEQKIARQRPENQTPDN